MVYFNILINFYPIFYFTVDYIDVDCKDLTTRYANDVIASCAFGLKVNSHVDVDNQFYARGKESSSFGFRQMIMFFLMMNMPRMTKVGSCFRRIFKYYFFYVPIDV